MGFFDRFRKREEEKIIRKEEIVPKRIVIGKVKEDVEKIISAELLREEQKMRELHGEIKEGFSSIREKAKLLGDSRFGGQGRLDPMVNMTKDNWVNKALSVSQEVPDVTAYNYSQLSSFHKNAGRVLSDLKNIPSKQAVMLTKFFREPTSRVIDSIKETEAKVKEMERVLENEGRKIMARDSVSESLEKLSGLSEKQKNLESQEKLLEKKTTELRKAVDEKEREREEIKKGGDFRDYVQADLNASRVRTGRDNAESSVREKFSQAKRGLKKTEHALSRSGGLGKEEESLLSNLTKSPFKTVLEDTAGVRRLVLSIHGKSVELDGEDRKGMEALAKSFETGEMERLLETYREAEKEIAEILKGKEQSPVKHSIERLESERKSIIHEIEELDRERRSLLKNREHAERELDEERKKLEEMVWKNVGQKIEIEI